MTSHGETTWADSLTAVIDPQAVTGIVSGFADLAMVVSDTGIIQTALLNPGFTALQESRDWEGSQVQNHLNYESVSKFDRHLKQLSDGSAGTLSVELNHKATDSRGEVPMSYSFHRVGSDGTILMLGSDLRPVAEMQQQLVAAQIALENDYELQREHEVRFRVLMESTNTAMVLVSVKSGHIVVCNAAAERLLGKDRDALIESPFAKEIESKGRGDIVDQLVAAVSESGAVPVIAKAVRGDHRLSLSPILFRGVSGQMLLCRIVTAKGQNGKFDELQSRLAELYRNGVDAIVFVDVAGHILSANDAFLRLADITHSQSIQGLSIAEFLARESVDLNVILQNTKRNGSMRLYATRLVSEHGTERTVEISTTRLEAGGQPVFGMIIRDSRRVETSQSPMRHVSDVDMQSVIELIGGQSLKDIVAKTTDVVEKMCIETAVEMTSNNRVAAAEMLGLSRQSLYVKLRKYGLVGKS